MKVPHPDMLQRFPKKSVGLTHIYFLYKNDEIVYIGKSKNLRQRINRHSYVFKGKFDSYSSYLCKDKEAYWAEKRMIEKYVPLLNIMDNSYNIVKLKKKKEFLERQVMWVGHRLMEEERDGSYNALRKKRKSL